MCILVVIRERVAGWPVVVGANRDEYRGRPWEAPRWDGDVLAPRDLRAGGTWIALHRDGFLVALTNRPEPEPDPARPSRGLLVTDLVRRGSVQAAFDLLEGELARRRRNAFQVLLAGAEECRVSVHPGPDGAALETVDVPPGLHTLTNVRGLDELDHRGALDTLDVVPGTTLEVALARMRAGLQTHADRGPGGRDEICKHGPARGTLSSSMAALPAPGSGAAPRLWFASGPPCESAHGEIRHFGGSR